MLKTMRRNVKSLSWTLWLVILAFIAFIFVQWGSGRLSPGGDESTLCRIGRRVVNVQEYSNMLVRTVDRYKEQLKNNYNKNFIIQLGIPEQVLQGMINSAVMQNEAERMGLEVSPSELKNAIINYPGFQRDGKFVGIEEYQRTLEYYHITPSSFENDLRKDLLAEKMREAVTAALVLDEKYLADEYQKENDKAQVEYLAFNTADITEPILVNDGEMAEYYARNKDKFLTPEKRAGYFLFLRQADMKAAVKIDEKAIYDYYKANKSTMFRIAGKTKVSRIFLKYETANREETQKKIEQISSEFTIDNFAQKAKQYSQDEKATAGGDWGYSDWQGFSSPEQQLIERLPEKQISSPIDTGAGFSILLITEKVAEQQESYDQVKERIRNILENETLAKKIQEKIQEVYGAVKEEKNLREKASLDKVKGMETGLVLNGDPIKNLDPMGYVSRRLFTLKLNEISSPFETPEGAAIVQLLQVMKPRVMDFAEAKEKVRAELTRLKKVDLVMARVKKISRQLEPLKDEKKVQEFLTKEKIKPAAEEYRHGNQLAGRPALSGLDEIVFGLPDGKYSSPIAFSTEVVLLKVKSKSMVSAEDFNKNRAEFAGKKIDQLKNEIFSSYIFQRRNAVKIFYNSKVYEQTKDYILGRI